MKSIDLKQLAKSLSGYGVTASVVVADEGSSGSGTGYIQLWLSLLGTIKSLTWIAQVSHWNVVGSEFVPVHEWFGKQYDLLFSAQDTVAEHIKTLDPDFMIPFDAERHSLLANTAQNSGSDSEARNLITGYRDDLRVLKSQIAELNKSAGDENDVGGADLLGGLAGNIDKEMWFAKSMLKSQQTVR